MTTKKTAFKMVGMEEKGITEQNDRTFKTCTDIPVLTEIYNAF
jgi:hypothetical protein